MSVCGQQRQVAAVTFHSQGGMNGYAWRAKIQVNNHEMNRKRSNKAHITLGALFVVIPLLNKYILELKSDIEKLDKEDEELLYTLQELEDCLETENELREAYEQEAKHVINYPSYSDLVRKRS